MAYKKSKRSNFQEVARERINYLLKLVNTAKDPVFASNCAKLISKLCLKHNIRLEKDEKVFCKSCFSCFSIEKPKIRIKTIKKHGQEYLQKRITCIKCIKTTTRNYKKIKKKNMG
ncbi:MAG: hypothetical protein COT55_00295 [Candidatus Diapherotrites archaeon CG09_land_8_20_14_0_10_32_12]|nr:MAG: hypothetical protein COT55_00295 [Candidatus Diapherotrites archaeon CG09_land_8_20_14_0_10_32_12]